MSGNSPESATAAVVVELQQLLLSAAGIDEFMQQLSDLAANSLPGAPSCGITIRRDRHPVTVASSDTLASQVDEIQYHHDNGPCLASLDSGDVVHVEDLASDRRWKGYRLPALSRGVRSSLSLPLRAEQKVVGAVNLYSTTARAFGPSKQDAATRFADDASRALTLAVRLAERAELSENLQHALASRAVIDQALGVIMGQNRCTADDAFAILSASSQHRNVKLRDVAAAIIAAVSGHPPPGGARFT